MLLDLALVVADDGAAADVEAALREGAGELLESLRLFDVYTGAAACRRGSRSLAYALTAAGAGPDADRRGGDAAARDAARRRRARTGAELRG